MTVTYKTVNELRQMINIGNKFYVYVIENDDGGLFSAGGYLVRFTIASSLFGICTQRVLDTDRVFPSIDKAVKTINETGYEGDVVIRR
jgi:hypothetical protein